jgi:hypothetical protein
VLQEFPPCSTCGYVVRVESIDMADLMTIDPAVLEPEEAAWRAHLRHTTRDKLAATPLAELRRRYDVAPIKRQFGQWAVTTYGLECLTDQYAIEKSRLFESDWERHMSEKAWVLMDDFVAAIQAARATYRIPVSMSTRFGILQRDQFRCRLCGHGADDGAVLEIDHIVPVSKGGSNRVTNLWTLCFECNRSKSARLLDPG